MNHPIVPIRSLPAIASTPAAPPSLAAQALATRLARGLPDRPTLLHILATQAADEVEVVRQAAERTLLEHCGDTVRLRGLIELSNRCTADCHYCGIRRSNRALTRYTLSIDEVVNAARWCGEIGYGSVVLQAGERHDARFVRFIADAVCAIREQTRTPALPQGVGITLGLGEQSPATYAAWFAAGAHRYLLRMETSSPRLFAVLHPARQIYAARLVCLKTLKAIGYRVGTGVMIGLPGQSLDDLVDDLLFFRDIGADMIGMGPYIAHAQAPLAGRLPDPARRMQLALRMIAATRLLLPDINIAATTALQTLAPDGREQGLRFGANVVMPQATPPRVRHQYTLYDGKSGVDDNATDWTSTARLEGRIHSVGRRMLRNAWGDSLPR